LRALLCLESGALVLRGASRHASAALEGKVVVIYPLLA
jgi:hypothetical protein